MWRRRRRDLFPPDRGLQARMLVATVIAMALVVGVLVGMVLLLVGPPSRRPIVYWCAGFAAFGWLNSLSYLPLRRYRPDDGGWHLAVGPGQQDRLSATVARLCVAADMRPPFCTAYPAFYAQCYTVAPLHRRPTVYASAGMLRALDDRELDAVVAHELSHIANRDAMLMTLLLKPTAVLLGRVWDIWATRRTAKVNGFVAVSIAILFLPAVLILAPVGMALTASARLVSRHRELYADRCAALLTGSPAAVSGALITVSGSDGSHHLPDLRATGERPELHIVADRPQPTGIGRIWATHPEVSARVARLDEMERALQHARIRPDVSAI